MVFALVIFCALVTCSYADDAYAPPPSPQYKPAPAYRPPPSYKPAPTYGKADTYDESPSPYTFQYGVHDEYSGTNFAATENADGKVTSGAYTVNLPDGRILELVCIPQ